jgi:hypothetical protein
VYQQYSYRQITCRQADDLKSHFPANKCQVFLGVCTICFEGSEFFLQPTDSTVKGKPAKPLSNKIKENLAKKFIRK